MVETRRFYLSAFGTMVAFLIYWPIASLVYDVPADRYFERAFFALLGAWIASPPLPPPQSGAE